MSERVGVKAEIAAVLSYCFAGMGNYEWKMSKSSEIQKLKNKIWSKVKINFKKLDF